LGVWEGLSHALPICVFILALFYYWFAIADRYAIFLYAHLGATPFDEVTTSRYWMSGLVASGAVMILYIAANALLGRIARARYSDYRAPAWWRVWLLCAPGLIVGIPFITMNFNQPTMPLAIAVSCVLSPLCGLAIALMPGVLAAQNPTALAWLALDGAGLMPALLLLRAVELPGRGLTITPTIAYLLAFGGVITGIVWLGVVGALRAWRRKPSPSAAEIFVAGLALSYVLLPLVHHLLATPPAFRYITTASNFFAFDVGVQAAAFIVAAGLAMGTVKIRHSLQRVGTT
jgi:hypothetical protein